MVVVVVKVALDMRSIFIFLAMRLVGRCHGSLALLGFGF
jgi:hypothetical protein